MKDKDLLHLESTLRKRVKQRDLEHLDPNERADLVNSFIFHALALEDPKDAVEHPLYWDLLSWCVEMIALYAQSLASAGETSLMVPAVDLSRMFYSLHYSLPDDSPELGPEREEHEEIWVERIEEWI